MLSIITSLYKSEKYLRDYFDAVEKFANDISDIPFEIHAIANKASKEERLLLSSFEKKNSYFKVHYIPLESLYATWNRGVSLAKYENVTFWNVDDIRFAKAAISGLKVLQENAKLVYFPFVYKRYISFFGYDILAKKITFYPPEFDRQRFVKEMHCGPFFMFQKALFKEIGPFDESFKIAGDYDWCVRAASHTPLTKCDDVAGIFHKRDGTLSGGRNPLQEQENVRVANKKIT